MVAEIRASWCQKTAPECFNGAATNWSRKSPVAARGDQAGRASMGPRPIGRGNSLPVIVADSRVWLQWGRDQLVAEMDAALQTRGVWVIASMGPRPIGRGNTPIHHAHTTSDRASMGPRPIGRGNCFARHSFRQRSTGFNGAATNWSRKCLLPCVLGRYLTPLQWGRDQLVAEISQDPSERKSGRRFNGAATNWSRKFSRIHAAASRNAGASMGPRPIGRGNAVDLVDHVDLNGASMGPRPIGRGNVGAGAAGGRWAYSFNGAATNWSRKSSTRAVLPMPGSPASMGPRPIGRGNTGWYRRSARAWRASMGPRPIGRGNAIRQIPRTSRPALLQWGRDQLVAEILLLLRGMSSPRHASMGPRPIGRGNKACSLIPCWRCNGFNGAATNWSRKWKYSLPR